MSPMPLPTPSRHAVRPPQKIAGPGASSDTLKRYCAEVDSYAAAVQQYCAQVDEMVQRWQRLPSAGFTHSEWRRHSLRAGKYR